MKFNENYARLEKSYLFADIAARIRAYQEAHPDKRLIRMGIGDVTQPLCPAVVAAFRAAVDEMGEKETFHGYGPEQGYDFLACAIGDYYKEKGVQLDRTEIFVSDGAKSDLGNILDLFDRDNTVLIPDPVYPVYKDTNVMDGRKIVFMDANANNNFLPMPDEDTRGDLIYLCSPNNPTGAAYSREQLAAWVDFARKNKAVILYDAAYEAFVSDPALPRSIFEIEGARECAVEFSSFSKMAGFTGTRCGWTVLPKELKNGDLSLNAMWLRRQTTKFNGVSYPVQRAAAAVFTPEGRRQTGEQLDYYKENARIMADSLAKMGLSFCGAFHSPYIWLSCPGGMDSWGFFDRLLHEIQVVGTPGAGFGKNGEGFFRLTAFGSREDTMEAMRRFETLAF